MEKTNNIKTKIHKYRCKNCKGQNILFDLWYSKIANTIEIKNKKGHCYDCSIDETRPPLLHTINGIQYYDGVVEIEEVK